MTLAVTNAPRSSALADLATTGRPRWVGRMAMLVLLGTMLPTISGFGWSAGGSGGSIFLSDLSLPVACLAVASVAFRVRGSWLSSALAAMVALAMIVGLYHGASFRLLVRDGRAPAYTIMGSVLAFYILVDRQNWQWCGTAIMVFLATNAMLLLVSQISGAALVGGNQDVMLYYGSSSVQLSSARAELPSDSLALVTVCGLGAGFLGGVDLRGAGIGGRKGTIAAVSSLLILFFSYSRNTVLGIGAGCLLAFIAPVGHGGSFRFGQKAAGMLTAFIKTTVVALVLIVPVDLLLGYGIGSKQLSTFNARVVSGLSGTALASDASVLWRQTETHIAIGVIKHHLPVGVGIGAYYRANVPGEPFAADYGRTYVHNYYLEMLVKLGVVGFIPLMIIVGGAVVRLIFQGVLEEGARTARVCAGCGLAALLTVAVVAPWPDQRDSAALFGALIAFGWLGYPRLRSITIAYHARYHPPLTGRTAVRRARI